MTDRRDRQNKPKNRRWSTTTDRWRSAAIVSCIVASASLLASCSSSYDAALREIALPTNDLLSVRVAEMVESAEHAVRSLEDADQWYTPGDETVSARTAALLRVSVNDAEAGVFDFTRRVLSVEDVASTATSDLVPALDRLRASMAACRESLNGAVGAFRSVVPAYDGADPPVPAASPDIHQSLLRARTDVDVLREAADPLTAR